jgi:UDP-N-acetylmuramyl pentapeptide phosphotransferase/UDP-N-acetylglucosamine-1-phosphate transferase
MMIGTVVEYLGFGIHLPFWLALLFSAFAIVGTMNAVNIIDGFNGLAGGTVLLVLLSFAATSAKTGAADLLYLNIVAIGALAGFLIFNFPQGKIFLGDGGAYMLGFLIAADGILLAGQYDEVSPWYVLAVMIYPVWEVIFSIIRKRREGKSPLEPDRHHLHMLVYDRGPGSNPLTAAVIVAAYCPFLSVATLFSHNSRVNFILVLLFILFYSSVYRYLNRRKREN